MEQILGRIELGASDKTINDLLRNAEPRPAQYTRHYSQGEDFFLHLDREIHVPHFPIHHDVRQSSPTSEYIEPLRRLLSELVPALPDVFADLTYFFDPGEILRPAFFKLYRIEDVTYLYLLRLDLHFNPNLFTVVDNGSNDVGPEFTTSRIFMDADVIPLEQVLYRDNKISGFEVEQLVSQTWIGETGRGYFVQGIWLDRELTKFFSKLFLPKGRFYPYYPFTCKYRSVCHTVIDLNADGRKNLIPMLHRIRAFLIPHMEKIQEALRRTSFSEELPEFQTLREQVPARWLEKFNTLRVRAYLNELDMKEFILEENDAHG
jgi:hypothetical protein